MQVHQLRTVAPVCKLGGKCALLLSEEAGRAPELFFISCFLPVPTFHLLFPACFLPSPLNPGRLKDTCMAGTKGQLPHP